MVNYENGKIYRIVCNKTGKQYIGATTIPLASRLSQHKKLFRNAKTCMSREVLEGGDYGIYLIEDCPADRKEQLLSRERYFIETTDCVNRKVPLRTKHEYYMDNRDELIKKQLEWNRENADKLKQYKAKYIEKLKNVHLLNITDTYDIDEMYNNFINHIHSLSSSDNIVTTNEKVLNEIIRIKN